MRWTGRTQEYIFDHGFQLDESGIIQIPKSKWNDLQYTDTSIRDPKIKTLMVPTDFGICLLFEHKHFVIV